MAAVETARGRALRMPLIAIEACPQPPVLKQLSRFDWLIFVSANAVTHSLDRHPKPVQLAPGTRVAAIGAATARALEQRGIKVSLQPQASANSEALLACAPLQRVEGENILILRGAGGRELLRQELEQRGAQVSYAECYRRVRPDADTKPLYHAWAAGKIVVISVTSVESLRNLVQIVEHDRRRDLLDAPLLVVGERQRHAALEMGWKGTIIVADDADPDAMVNALSAAMPGIQSG